MEELAGNWNKELVAFVMRHPLCPWGQPHPFTAVSMAGHLVLISSSAGDRRWQAPVISGEGSSVLRFNDMTCR